MRETSDPSPRRPTILFDLDGTLIDSIELILNSARYAFEKLERTPPTDAEWLASVGIPLFTTFGKYARDKEDCAALIAAYREYQFANHDRLTRCYDNVSHTVVALKERGHEIGIVTSKSEALALRALALFGLARHMDTIVGCDGSSRHKPDPEPVHIALTRLGSAPGDAIFVGDSVHDIIAGNAAGVTTVAATWGAFTRSDLESVSPSLFLDDISGLLDLVA
jgi:pyrophosphatase PpaX